VRKRREPDAVGEEKNPKRVSHADVIAAFDQVRAEAHELQRRHREQVRSSRANDRPARNERHSGK
jgi:hypothetical protein